MSNTPQFSVRCPAEVLAQIDAIMHARDKERAERYGYTSRKTKRTTVILELIKEALEVRARPPAPVLEQVSPSRPTRHPSGDGKRAREKQNRVTAAARRVKREPKTRRKLAPAPAKRKAAKPTKRRR